MSLRYLLLGLLSQRPMSGYDIRRFLRGLGWLIGIPSPGSLYPILRALLQEGLLTVEIVPGLERPPRKIYTLTEAGRDALQAWLEEPVASTAPLRIFVMRLLLAGNYSSETLARHLKQRRTQVAEHQALLSQMLGKNGAETDSGQRLALNYGLALADAELAWLDGHLDQMS